MDLLAAGEKVLNAVLSGALLLHLEALLKLVVNFLAPIQLLFVLLVLRDLLCHLIGHWPLGGGTYCHLFVLGLPQQGSAVVVLIPTFLVVFIA